MRKIVPVQPDGASQTVDAPAGQSLMEAATQNNARGIVGDCGGACSCATCRAYIDAPWAEQLKPADDIETGMREGALDVEPSSRLDCQIAVSDALDRIVVRAPVR
ncbi:2Fe-2S iron-sulfur cluster-binding protein [Solimonas soli]|uniref:2Fe-2S iron-sulfur cluster-binding protein n=1 Tax=Solimonas soli TaxID=413479 RepID=UPI0004832941|nr:2Fe-2S iron-sulfur cluster-binding protein [Solimonas soli]